MDTVEGVAAATQEEEGGDMEEEEVRSIRILIFAFSCTNMFVYPSSSRHTVE